MAPLVRRGWSPRGVAPLIHQVGRSWDKVTMIAAVTVSPGRRRVGLYFSQHAGQNINARLVIRFLRHLQGHLRGNMVVIWDRLNAHRGREMRAFLRGRRRIHLEMLPPYAPELNPTEYLWSYLKRNPLANRPFYDLATMVSTAGYHARAVWKRQSLLRSFIHHSPLFLRLR